MGHQKKKISQVHYYVPRNKVFSLANVFSSTFIDLVLRPKSGTGLSSRSANIQAVVWLMASKS